MGCRGLDLAESNKFFRFLGCNYFRTGPRQVVTWNSSFIFGIDPDIKRTILKGDMDGEFLVSNGPTHPFSTPLRHPRGPLKATQVAGHIQDNARTHFDPPVLYPCLALTPSCPSPATTSTWGAPRLG